MNLASNPIGGPSTPNRVWSDERVCLLATLAVAAFIIFGSLMPFDLRMPAPPTAAAWLAHVRFTGWAGVSRSDLLVNVAISVPLGFFLMGTLARRFCRCRRPMTLAATVLVVGCVSALLGAGVELVQVLSVTRQSSWNDVVAQGVGGGAGAAAWTVFGAHVIQWLRRLGKGRGFSRLGASEAGS